jgi:hypothetical protein
VSLPVLREIRVALRNLNPGHVKALAERPVHFGILALDEYACSRMMDFLVPAGLSPAKARNAGRHIIRMAAETDFARCDCGFSESGLPHPEHFYRFDDSRPEKSVEVLLEENEELWIPLARTFVNFREPVIQRIILKIAKENALFTLATALPNFVPSLISAPWAVGEFASDSAFLTMNQVRMAFLIGAASDRDVGYNDQRGQIGAIISAAFGWRAIARELISKVPAGGGLITKGLISYAGTYVVGAGLERYMRFGRKLSRAEKKDLYKQAYERGRATVTEMVERLTGRFSRAPAA